MNTQHLRYFVELAHTHSYTLSAQRLNITQPSLSYAIDQLEKELGVKLFVKSGRSNILTGYGREFLPYAEGALKTMDAGAEAVRHSVNQDTVIRIGFLRYLGVRYIPTLIREFKEAYPQYQVRFEFETGSTALLLDGLNACRFDAVFCAPSRSLRENTTLIGRQSLKLIVPEDHPLAERDTVRLEETLPYTYIYYARGSSMRNIISPYFAPRPSPPKVLYEVLEEQVVAGFVAQGFGIGIVPQMDMLDTLPLKVLELTEPEMGRNIFLVPVDSQDVSPVLNLFLDFVRHRPVVTDKR